MTNETGMKKWDICSAIPLPLQRETFKAPVSSQKKREKKQMNRFVIFLFFWEMLDYSTVLLIIPEQPKKKILLSLKRLIYGHINFFVKLFVHVQAQLTVSIVLNHNSIQRETHLNKWMNETVPNRSYKRCIQDCFCFVKLITLDKLSTHCICHFKKSQKKKILWLNTQH